MTNMLPRLLLVGVSAIALHAIPAGAQVVPDSQLAASEPSVEPDAAEVAKGDIVVTARRKNERLQDVPISITALSPEVIRSQNVVGPEDIARLTPGVNAVISGTIRNGASYTVRGQGAASLGADTAVITYFDEVATSAPGPGFLFDVGGVNVLKGPQGTLFGRNTTGGAVLISPQTPTSKLEGYVDVTIGNYDHKRLQAALNIPIVEDKVLLRVATDIYRRNGYTKDINTGQDYDDRNYQAFRGTLVVKPTDWLENKTLVNFSYAYGEQAGTSIVNANPTGLLALIIPGFVAETAAQLARGPRRVAYDYQDGESLFRALAINNVTTFRLSDDVSIKNIFGYRDTRVVNADDTDSTIFPIIGYLRPPSGWQTFPFPDAPQKTISEELQINGTTLDKALQYTAGLYYERRNPAREDAYDLSFFFTPNNPTYNQTLRYDRSLGVYGQISYAITEQLKATVGGRYTWDTRRQTSSNYLTNPGAGIDACTLSGYYCGLKQEKKFKSPTYTLNLQYQPERDLMFYISSRRGYKTGGFNALASSELGSFQPEYVTDYEVGSKSVFRFADTTLRLNLAAYRSNFTDRQVPQLLLFNGALTSATVNAGKGYIQGIEFDGNIDLSSRLVLSGGFAYTDGKFTDLTLAGVDFSRQPIPNVSKFSYNISGDFTVVKSDAIGAIAINANYSHYSKFSASLNTTGASTNPLGTLSPAYGQLNLRVDWRGVAGSTFDLSVFATNATNKTRLIGLSDLYDALGYSSGVYNEPRMFGVQGRYSF